MNQINRRQFIGTTALSTRGRGAVETGSKVRKLKLGLIGCGWYGMMDVTGSKVLWDGVPRADRWQS